MLIKIQVMSGIYGIVITPFQYFLTKNILRQLNLTLRVDKWYTG